MPGFSVDLSSRNNDSYATEISCLLQFGWRPGLSPAKARAKITQPAKQIIGALLIDGFFVEQLDLFAFGQLSNRSRRPPTSWQIQIGTETIVVPVDVPESRAATGRLVMLVCRFVDGQPVDDCS